MLVSPHISHLNYFTFKTAGEPSGIKKKKSFHNIFVLHSPGNKSKRDCVPSMKNPHLATAPQEASPLWLPLVDLFCHCHPVPFTQSPAT